MTIQFNVDEILAMAQRIEENGAAYYRKAARLNADTANVDFLNKMAEMEDGHKDTFVAMREDLTRIEKQETVFDPFDEEALYLQAMADGHGGEGDPKFIEALTGNEPMENILLTALVLEKKSIDFYQSLKAFVPKNLGKDKLDVIIKEEQEHMVTLAKEVKALRG